MKALSVSRAERGIALSALARELNQHVRLTTELSRHLVQPGTRD